MAVAEHPVRSRLTERSLSVRLSLLGLIALAAALRWACIHQSLFGDELFLYSRVHGQSFTRMLALVHDNENTPPLFFIVDWVFAKGSDPMVLVRLPSLLANVGLVALVFVLGRRAFGVSAGLVGAAWLAINPFQIFYGTEDRAYSAVALLVAVSTLAMLAAVEVPQRRRLWALYAAASIAAIYTHYVAALVLVPQAAWALWRHRAAARRLLGWNGLVVASFVPWIPFFVLQARHSARESDRLSALTPLTPWNALRTQIQALIGHPFIAPGQLPGLVPSLVLGALLLILVVAVIRHRPQLSGAQELTVLLALSPIVLIVIYSLRPRTSLLLPRNLEVGIPYASVLIGWLLTRWRLRWSLALCLVAFGAIAVGTVKMLTPAYQRPDGRAAARFIDAHAGADATVIDFPGPQGTQFYFRRVHHLTPAEEFSWVAAAAARRQVFLTYLSDVRCTTSEPGFTLAASGSWPSVPLRLVVCEYAPRAG